MKQCSDYQEMLLLDVYGELNPLERHAWENHLGACEHCRKEKEHLVRLLQTIKTALLAISFAFIMNSCEGPMGPPGQDGEALIGSIFEFEGDFLPSNNYKLYYTFPSNFKIYDTDVVLVYILWDVVNLNGKNTDVWRLIPQTLVYDEGILQYNFDYTIKDVSVFIETTMPFTNNTVVANFSGAGGGLYFNAGKETPGYSSTPRPGPQPPRAALRCRTGNRLRQSSTPARSGSGRECPGTSRWQSRAGCCRPASGS